MKRTLENLAQKRQEKESAFSRQLKEFEKRIHSLPLSNSIGDQPVRDLFSSMAKLFELNTELTNIKDKEWDALSSNHVGIIFKSMEWKIDKLAAGYEDATLLMKRFILLKEKLNRLLAVLEKKDLPTVPQVEEMAQPLQDSSYAGFENRYRGSEEEVRKQQENYLPYFAPGKKVLDLGCGRGEFISLLNQNGVEAEGIDLNDQMVEICRNKGLNCRKADILEVLSAHKDNSLGGIFSSQVVEHLAPAYLKRMIELAYLKLASDSCIVLETINPASVFSLVEVYFLDLSHQQPVHPQALKFLLEISGFEEVEITYASPLEEERLETLPSADDVATILNRNFDKLNRLLYASTNYAAIGKKP